MYNKGSPMEDFNQAIEDADKAIEKRPKDKFYLSHKQELIKTMESTLAQRVKFAKDLVGKAVYAYNQIEKMR